MTSTNTDAGREAAVKAYNKIEFDNCLELSRAECQRKAIQGAIDAFLSKALEGADEKLAEILARIVDDYMGVPQPDAGQRLEDAKTLLAAFARSQMLLLNAEREITDDKETIRALQSELTATRNALEEERERCAKVCDEWLAKFASYAPSYVSAQDWANDAVKDIAIVIRALPSLQVKED